MNLTTKRKIQMLIDLAMTILLPTLMAYGLVGEAAHEWLGIAMFSLFLAHQVMNAAWYKSLFKRRYTVRRTANTVIDGLLFVDMILLMVSGMIMSRHVFAELPLKGWMAFGRAAHMLAAYWGYALMSVHIGFHINAMKGAMRKATGVSKQSTLRATVLRALAIAISAYGVYAFIKRQIGAYMLFHIQFVFFDHSEPPIFFFVDYLAVMFLFAYGGHVLSGILGRLQSKEGNMKKISSVIFVTLLMTTTLAGCGSAETPTESAPDTSSNTASDTPSAPAPDSWSEESQSAIQTETPEGFILVAGGTFTMGSPDSEAEREADEVRHTVTVSGFYIAPSEVTQAQYNTVMGGNPSANQGDNLPVENVTWYDAVNYCNALSERDGLTPTYTIEGQSVTWDRSADGYRLPTEAEWEFASRAGTETPFSFGDYVEDSDANCYNAYGYNNDATGNWVNGYLQHIVAVDSYSPNSLGLYNMHGNVAEWVWDWYGAYSTESASDPTGVGEGNYKVARGGGWNDFPKNIRSAYRSAFPADVPLYSIGFRLARNAEPDDGSVTSINLAQAESTGGKVLIAYFSASGNTKGIAESIESMTGADLFRIERQEPYRSLYADALGEQRANEVPDLAEYLEDAGLDINQYDTILIGYCNWWASIPAPVRTFLMRYDLSGKTIIPFCSHGGGLFGQSVSTVAKLAPDSTIKEGFHASYSSYDNNRISAWLEGHGIQVR